VTAHIEFLCHMVWKFTTTINAERNDAYILWGYSKPTQNLIILNFLKAIQWTRHIIHREIVENSATTNDFELVLLTKEIVHIPWWTCSLNSKVFISIQQNEKIQLWRINHFMNYLLSCLLMKNVWKMIKTFLWS